MQTYANHRRFNPIHHFFAAPICSAACAWSLVRFVQDPSAGSGLVALIGLGLAGTVFAARGQALTVQNRVIRLEMSLRCARVLPADLAAKMHTLALGQIIALRFAGDTELPELTRKTLAGEFATPKDIKRAIRDWQPDDLRA